MQQGDVLLQQIDDGGEITVSGGLVEMSGGLETSAYLSLFGGNELDDGRADNSQTYWGNLSENIESRKYISETGHLLLSLESTVANLRRLEDAARRDLAWLLTEKVASSITVVAFMPGLNRVGLEITIIADGEESTFRFVENWKASI